MKRKKLLRTILIAIFIILALYYIYPTVILSSLEKKEEEKIIRLSNLSGLPTSEVYQNIYRDDVDFSALLTERGLSKDTLASSNALVDDLKNKMSKKLLKIRTKSIKEGLDLKGGMHLVLEVDMVRLLENVARQKDPQFYTLQEQLKERLKAPDADFYQELIPVFRANNVPLNRYFGDLRDSEGEIMDLLKKEAGDGIDRSLEIMRNRVDQFGVSEPTIQKQGEYRIIVELPGVHDPARARALIGKTALLEFKLLADADKTQKVLSDIDSFLKNEKTANLKSPVNPAVPTPAPDTAAKTPPDTASAAAKESKDKVVKVTDLFGEGTSVSQTDTSLLVDSELMEEHPFYTLLRNIQGNISVPKQNFGLVSRIINRTEIKQLLPADYQFQWSNKPEVSSLDGNSYYTLYYIKREPELTGAALRDAQVQIQGGSSGGAAAGMPIVGLELNRDGAKTFARVTGANVGKFLSIVLDDKVHMAPRIKTKIPDGRAIIEGNFTMEEAKDLSIVLRAGALPAPVEIIEERTVGPSLGNDSIAQGTFSGLLGTLLVIFFMIWYYRLSGSIAIAALVLNIVFLIAILAGFHGTLTLPGIAGIVLTIGMAVDANVLIYERIREELRSGKTVKAAVDAGYSRATVTILDANITTLISAIVLYQFGTGPIQGFALTLIIGLTASLFTSIVVTRAIFDWLLDKFNPKTLSI